MKRAFHDWAWIGRKRRVGFCWANWEDGLPWTTRGGISASPGFFGVRIPFTRYYLSTCKRP